MRAWLGHYANDPTAWFVAWGRNVADAALEVDCAVAQPDLDSMRPLRGGGFVGFRARLAADRDGLEFTFESPAVRLDWMDGDRVERGVVGAVMDGRLDGSPRDPPVADNSGDGAVPAADAS